MMPEISYSWQQVKSWNLRELLNKARQLSWQIHGKRVQYFIPGQMVYMGDQGKYPHISLTGKLRSLLSKDPGRHDTGSGTSSIKGSLQASG
jgi:hypothetical protein